MRLYYLLLYNTTHNHLYHKLDLFMLFSSYKMRVQFLLHLSFVLNFLAINSFLDISIIIFSSVSFYAASFTWESSLCVKMFLANFFLPPTLIETQIIQQLGIICFLSHYFCLKFVQEKNSPTHISVSFLFIHKMIYTCHKQHK